MISRFLSARRAPLLLLLVVLVLFGDVLFFPGGQVLSHVREDGETQFAFWYDFGFKQLAQGHLALWNPHVFSGTPWFGNFESALLYPLNWIFAVMPVPLAMNWIVAIHVFLTGWFTFLWVNRRGLGVPASLLSALLVMLGAPYFLRVVPGHLTNMAAMAWTPLVLLAVDGVFRTLGQAPAEGTSIRRRILPYILCGSLAVVMQLLAGHPQTVFRTGVTVFIYFVFRALEQKMSPRRAAGVLCGIACIYIAAVLLGAAQLAAGLATAAESTRRHGVSLDFVSFSSFPPENLITLLSPDFFGNETDLRYWGRWLPWEATIFWGVTGLFLVITGIVRETKHRRWALPAMLPALFLMALGSYTPLLGILYSFVPGFNRFRISAEFVYPMALFGALLAGEGWQGLRKMSSRSVWQYGLSFSAGLAGVMGVAGFLLVTFSTPALRFIAALMARLSAYPESPTHAELRAFLNPSFIPSAAEMAGASLLAAFAVLFVLTFLIWRLPKSPRAAYLILLLAFAEVFTFAARHRPTFYFPRTEQPLVKSYLASHPGDYRILNLVSLNSGMTTGARDIWGYDPLMMERYAQFMAWTQGDSPDGVSILVNVRRTHPLLRMLRCQAVFLPSMTHPGQVKLGELPPSLPHALLLSRYQVCPNRDTVFHAMGKPGFNPAQEVILETEPNPRPQPAGVGTINITDIGTDFITFAVTTSKPAILVVTDSYCKGWQARALPGSVQQHYDVLPANYVLRAIPLQAGKHILRLEYTPRGFVLGAWISLISWGIFLTVGGCFLWNRVKSRQQAALELR